MAQEKAQLTILQKFTLEALWILCRGFALLPHFIRHGVFTNLTYALLRALRYRQRVMMDNLRHSFPSKSESELKKICNGAYYNLAEQIINTVSQSGVSDKTLLKRMTFTNDKQTREAVGGGSVIMLTAHYGP